MASSPHPFLHEEQLTCPRSNAEAKVRIEPEISFEGTFSKIESSCIKSPQNKIEPLLLKKPISKNRSVAPQYSSRCHVAPQSSTSRCHAPVKFGSQSLVPNPGTELLLVEKSVLPKVALMVMQPRTKHLPEAYGDTGDLKLSHIFPPDSQEVQNLFSPLP